MREKNSIGTSSSANHQESRIRTKKKKKQNLIAEEDGSDGEAAEGASGVNGDMRGEGFDDRLLQVVAAGAAAGRRRSCIHNPRN